MKKHLIMAVIASGIFFINTNSFADDQLPSNSVNLSTVVQNLQKAGYTGIHKIKFEHNVYQAIAINPEGRPVRVAVNPANGEVSKPSKQLQEQLTLLDAVKKVEGAGYTQITKIDLEDNKFEVKATDKNGKKVDVEVDGQTGNIKED
jgi:uncharacterized membrane protein YkoI